MTLALNQSILNELVSDISFKREITDYLNSVIETNLQKSDDEIDTAMIDDCVRIIAAIESDTVSELLENSEKQTVPLKVSRFADKKHNQKRGNNPYSIM